MADNKDAWVFHVGAHPQSVDPHETPEQAAAREQLEADIHAPEAAPPGAGIVFDDRGTPVSVDAADKDRAADAAKERAQHRSDGGKR